MTGARAAPGVRGGTRRWFFVAIQRDGINGGLQYPGAGCFNFVAHRYAFSLRTSIRATAACTEIS